MDNQKRCSSCRRMLELDEYPWDRGKRYATCRACKALYVKNYYDLTHERRGRRGPTIPVSGEQHPKAKLTWPGVRAIRARAAAGANRDALAVEFGVSPSAVDYVLARTTWRE